MTDVTVTGMLTVDGSTTLRSQLSSANFSRLQAVAVQGSLAVSGPAQLFAALEAPRLVCNGGLNVSAPAEVRACDFSGLVIMEQTLDASGTLSAAADLSCSELTSTGTAQASLSGGGAAAALESESLVAAVATVDELVSSGPTVLASVTAASANVARGSAQVLRVNGDYRFLDSLLEVSFLTAGSAQITGDCSALELAVGDYVFTDGDLSLTRDVTASGRVALGAGGPALAVTSQNFVDPTGLPLTATAALTPGSTLFAGEIVISGLATEVFGSLSSVVASFLEITFEATLPQAPLVKLQAGESWTSFPDTFWTVTPTTTRLRLQVPVGSSQAIPPAGELRMPYMMWSLGA